MKTKKTNKVEESEVTALNVQQLNKDMMVSVLIVSLTVNAFVLIGWITLQVTSVYDAQVASFLFTR